MASFWPCLAYNFKVIDFFMFKSNEISWRKRKKHSLNLALWHFLSLSLRLFSHQIKTLARSEYSCHLWFKISYGTEFLKNSRTKKLLFRHCFECKLWWKIFKAIFKKKIFRNVPHLSNNNLPKDTHLLEKFCLLSKIFFI